MSFFSLPPISAVPLKVWDLVVHDIQHLTLFTPENQLLSDLLIFIKIKGCHLFNEKLHCLQLTFQLNVHKESHHNVKYEPVG